MRLVEGGSPALGDGEGKGYPRDRRAACAVKIWSVSHGHCIEKHSHRGSARARATAVWMPRRMGLAGMNAPIHSAPRAISVPRNAASAEPRRPTSSSNRREINPCRPAPPRRRGPVPLGGRASSVSGGGHSIGESICVYDSSAYFIRDMATGREVLIFGDVEPDSISLSPRNLQIWQEAAPKIAAGTLAAIFIECSYDDSQSVDRLFGHLTPRFIAEEMIALASEVSAARTQLLHEKESGDRAAGSEKKKRKRKATTAC